MASRSQPLSFDCYEVLDVDKSAAPKDVNKAYKRLALMYHPDKNQDKDEDNDEAAGRFHRVRVAYKILGHELWRKIYDDYGRSVFSEDGGLHLMPLFISDVDLLFDGIKTSDSKADLTSVSHNPSTQDESVGINNDAHTQPNAESNSATRQMSKKPGKKLCSCTKAQSDDN